MSCNNLITVSPKEKTLFIGEHFSDYSVQLSFEPTEEVGISWYSTSPSVATVNENMGYIIARGVGTAKIFACTCDGCCCCDYMTVTVVEDLTVGKNSLQLSIKEGERATLEAPPLEDGSPNKNVNWSVGNPMIVSVHGGAIYARSKGSTVLSVALNDTTHTKIKHLINVTDKKLIIMLEPKEPSRIQLYNSTFFADFIIYPGDADCQCLEWSSNNEDVVYVNSETGFVRCKGPGDAIIYATAKDGSGVVGQMEVTVKKPVEPQSISLDRESILLTEIGQTAFLTASVSPSNAKMDNITWNAYPDYIVDINDRGIITAVSEGTAVITAETENGFTARCTVTVDTRPQVTVSKDGDFFTVTFEDTGHMWKSIGCDLTLDENRSGISLEYPPYYDSLNIYEKRYVDNTKITFTEQELGFTYLLDPFGIEYYIRKHETSRRPLEEGLFFKDRVYKEIFGVPPRLIKVFPDKSISYYTYPNSITASDRAKYYTDAEILFGEHTIADWTSWVSFISDVIPSVALNIFSIYYPPVGIVLGTIELTKFLFFSAAATNVLSSGSTSIMCEYTAEVYTMAHNDGSNDIRKKIERPMGWANVILSAIPTIINAAQVFCPPIHDITTYTRANSSDYCIKYNAYGSELTMEQIISKLSSN